MHTNGNCVSNVCPSKQNRTVRTVYLSPCASTNDGYILYTC